MVWAIKPQSSRASSVVVDLGVVNSQNAKCKNVKLRESTIVLQLACANSQIIICDLPCYVFRRLCSQPLL